MSEHAARPRIAPITTVLWPVVRLGMLLAGCLLIEVWDSRAYLGIGLIAIACYLDGASARINRRRKRRPQPPEEGTQP